MGDEGLESTGAGRSTIVEGRVSFGRRLAILAAEHPEKPALIVISRDGDERVLSWSSLDRDSNRVARLLARRGAAEHSWVVVALPNGLEHFLVSFAAWKIGAGVLPLSAALPKRERDALLALARPSLVVGEWGDTDWNRVTPRELSEADAFADDPHPDCIPCPGKAIASGGSTGRPKLIVDPSPWGRVAEIDPTEGLVESMGYWLGMRPRQTQLIAGPLYHNAPFTWSHVGLFEDHRLVVMERFDAARALDLIERYQVNWAFLVPTMMHRMIRQNDIDSRNFSSVDAFWHAGAFCAPWLKEAWIRLLGGDRLYEIYGATEAVGLTVIRGDEWLEHRGSVGRPRDSEVRIVDDLGNDVPRGDIGEVFMRPTSHTAPTFSYLGTAVPKTLDKRWVSVGDLGWVDEGGYLFLADRRTDLILSGGANIYPAEVEAAVSEHQAVLDVAVVGRPDDEWGQRVHAVIQPRDASSPPTVEELDAHCRARLVSYKVPRSYEFVAQLPRLESGKIRRSALGGE